ncbi:MAG TPA: hypothetical protein VNT99_04475 [Methylomirabilota bacterium]|nr:hypothetical protein [Methylomirabilota bacterium]
MISKRILVLANSTKHHPMRCVAGRELIEEGGGKSRWGGWIRPVSAHDEGALNSGERCLAGAVDPKQQRGLFNYKGRHYDFALTDPLIGQKYFPDYPRTAEGYIAPKDPRQILLCVSLTPPFNELHYKVIATVLELAP